MSEWKIIAVVGHDESVQGEKKRVRELDDSRIVLVQVITDISGKVKIVDNGSNMIPDYPIN